MSETDIYPTTYLDLPVRDGQPMGETDRHALEMTEFLRDVLRDYYADEAMVYVASNNFVYYNPRNVKESVSPDCYVIKGIEKKLRPSYQAWTEGGRLPQVIFELTSERTWRSDTVYKRRLYQSWSCQEYFLYDPFGIRIPGHLIGYRLENGRYEQLVLNEQGRLVSEELQLELAHWEGHLRFFKPGASQPLPTRAERADQEQQRADKELERAEREQARANKERQRADEERERADKEQARAELERERAEEQCKRADEAERELERLRAELAALKKKKHGG